MRLFDRPEAEGIKTGDQRPHRRHPQFRHGLGVGGWLLMPFLQKIGPEASEALRWRVATEIKTTFASHYTSVISLQEALNLETIAAYNRRATGEKFLIAPHKAV